MNRQDGSLPDVFQLNEWTVVRNEHTLRRNGYTERLEPRFMKVLEVLAENAGDVVARQRLLETAWEGVIVEDTAVSQAISHLRKVLGDDPKAPRFIRTIPTRGYQLIPTPTPIESEFTASARTDVAGRNGILAEDPAARKKGFRRIAMKPAILLVSVSLLAVFFFVALIPEPPAAERIPISPPEPASAPIQIWDDVSPEDLLSMDRSRPFPSESSAASRPRLIGGSFLVYFSFNEGEAALTVRALTGDDRTPSDRYVHYLGDVVDFEPHPTLEQLLLLRTCPAGGQWTALRIGDPVAREMEYCAPRDSQHRWVFDSAEIIRRDDASPLRLISDRSDGQDDDRWTMLPPGTRHYILEDSGIVFVREGKSGIWLKRWRSEEPELLTQESASVIPTAWYIQGADLFYAVKAADGHTEIRTMHVRSGRSRSVTTISGAAGSLNSFVLDEKAGRLYASMETGG